MVAYLSKSDACEGFNQIIDFLNGRSIKYALMVNPNICVSCIKQFWTTIVVKQVNDVPRLQALVDKEKVVVTEATIQEALRLDDEEGVECLPNEEIFAELARMGYEKPSTKLTFYKAFFSSQWKVGKGFSRVETPLFESMLVEQQVHEEGDADENVKEVNAGDAAEGDVSAAHGEGRMIAEVDADADVVLEDVKEAADEAKEVAEDAKLITKIVTAASETITAASTNITAAEAQVLAATLTAAPARVTTAPSRRRKGVVITDPEKESTTSTIIPAETKSKDKGKGILDEVIDHVKIKAKEDPAVKKYQALKRKPQTEAQARKNMMLYLKNVAGFKMDYFKGMSYDDIRPIFEAKFNSNRAAKRRKLDEEVEELKRHLQMVPNADDDVYTEATPLARKVPIVDYQIIEMNNKPYYKIIRADGTHQLYKNQRSVHGPAKVKGWKLLESCGVQIITFTTTQLILLVERKYPLTRLTLDQMLNAIRLEVEEESEVSLELLRFTRQQHQEGQLE
uniref:Xylulose kinase-1 n=1 Tax=Tanacetum cinerariifolium TaxID=118510 RepID=A0A699I5U0_TANCI|nr:hypothetical protein [Tanacetum cinerariifolium]